MPNIKNAICILPLGAHEYHGPHLPLETDAIIAQAFVTALQNIDIPNEKLQILPVEKTGYSVEHMDASGSKTLSYDEAIKRWIKIGDVAYENGFEKLLLLNAHGGNSPLMTIVTTELRMRHKMLAVATSWNRFGLPDNLMPLDEKHLDIHGGFIETSLMLHLAPSMVKMEKAENFTNKQAEYIKNYHYLRAYGPHAFGWKMCDLNKKGAAGNAKSANATAGKAIFDHALLGLSSLIDDIYHFDVTSLC